MNRADLQKLASVQQYPSVSILLPTHRGAPDRRQDPIRVKNLVAQAGERLLAEFPRREVAPLLRRLEASAADIDYRRSLDGLALFANKQYAQAFAIPFPVRERVIVDHTFATRDLVFALNRSVRYWVVALAEKPSRLLEGNGPNLLEVTDFGFPLEFPGPGGGGRLPGGQDLNRAEYQDRALAQFLRKVDRSLAKALTADALPLVVVGVKRHLGLWDQVSQHASLVIATLEGSHGRTPPTRLAQLVWPRVQEGMQQRQGQALRELEQAVSAGQAASGMSSAWRAAVQGQGATLLVEQDFHYPAQLDASGLVLTPAPAASAPGVIDDAVDELIETVLAKSGRVVFCESGALAAYQRVALILRYA